METTKIKTSANVGLPANKFHVYTRPRRFPFVVFIINSDFVDGYFEWLDR